MNCPSCNQPQPASAWACSNCGAQLQTSVGPESPPQTWGPASYPMAVGAYPAVYAGFWKRFAANFIDGLILGGIGFVVGALLGFAFPDITQYSWVSTLLGAVIGFFYFTIMESSEHQATFGKRALNIRVTDMKGGRISFGRAAGRYLAKSLSTLTFFIGYLMAAFTEKKQALHDMIAGTLVVE